MRATKLIVLSLISIGAVMTAPIALAEVPVVDLTQQTPSTLSNSNVTSTELDTPAPVSASSMALEQRVAVLERQMTNLTQMDLVGQISHLQQEVAKLRGQLEVQSYELKRLTEQVKAQYQDIDSRLSSQSIKIPAKDLSPSAQPIPTAKPMKPIVDPLQTSTNTASGGNVTLDTANAVDTETSSESQEQQVYQAAIEFSKKGDYVRATTAFQNYLAQYPHGKFAANGHYWLGEIYLIQGQPDPAAAEFKTVINSFPTTPKVPDAALKLGQAYYDKGDWKRAKEHFQKVQKQFPNTPAALSASSKLQKMQQEGKGR